jgi:TonB-linked SusC/RagA family outer membrane protein
MYMRLLNIFYQKIAAGLLLLCLVITLPGQSQVPQKAKKIRQLIDVTIKVTDNTEAPVPKASVVVGEGIIHTETDANGSVTFKAYPEDIVTVSLPPFEPYKNVAIELVRSKIVRLSRSKYHMTSADDVALPFTTLKKRKLTGPEVVVPGSRFERYPTVDIRNTFTGMTSGFDIRELDGSPGLSSQEGLQNFTGLSNSYGSTDKFSNMPMIIVDGMPSYIQEAPIDPTEIESATWVKGILSTAMFGPQANGGVLMITTKHGVKNEKVLTVDAESGVSTIDRMPGWTSGVDYAKLNNLARTNSGVTTLYTQAAMDEYAKNDPNSLRYPNVNYRDMMLRNTKTMDRVNVSASGGNDIVQYFSNIGFAKEGDIYKMGADADYTRIIARQNATVKINDQFDVKFSFYGNQNWRRSSNYGYDPEWSSEGTDNATLTLTELPSVLSDINLLPPIANPVYGATQTVEGVPYYMVNTAFLTYASGNPYGVSSGYPLANPIGNLVSQGYYADRSRTGVINATLNYNFGNMIKGLKSSTYFGLNVHNLVRLGKSNDYMAVVPAISTKTGNDTISRHSSHTLSQMTSQNKLMDYFEQHYAVYEALSYNRTFGVHDIQSVLTAFMSKTFINGIEEPFRQMTYVSSSTYSFKDKYTLQAVLNYSGSSSFAKDNRYKLFPSFGANWVVSDEPFMSNVGFVNYLKLRAQAGVIGNETFLMPHYDETRWSQDASGSAFGPYSSSQWFGSTQDGSVRRTSLQRSGNDELKWETRKEINVGLDALLFNRKLSLDLTYWHWKNEGAIAQPNNLYPFVAGLQGGRPWLNFAESKYNSVTADLQYSDKFGQFEFTLGANATATKGIRVKYDEPNYRFDYQKRTGKTTDAIFGQSFIGKFQTDAEALVVPQRFDDVLYTGDLKYADKNDDGIIDDNDQNMIGHSSPRLYYGLNVTLKLKGFELFILGAGRAFYDQTLTNAYFWNGWGNYNYSNFVLNNLGEAYPRLTYYKVNNNFVTSDFWMKKGDYFKIQNVEFSYTIPAKAVQFMGSRGIKIYVRGANLLTFSQIKDVDPESVNSGVSVYPLFKTFTGGIKFNF